LQVLCSVNDISAPGGLEITLRESGETRYLAVFRLGGEVRAYLNTCPHQGRNLNFGPAEFLFTAEGQLVCPHHGACFNVSTGICTDGPCKGDSLTPVDIVVESGQVLLA
jgi:nitrite reductase/ring-hydroxylating ferredoxin subunit